METTKILELAVKALDDKKAKGLNVIKVEEITSLCKYFVIATGTSTTHVKSLIDEVDEVISKAGEEPAKREGYQSGSWILLDYIDVIVNVFTPDAREFYSLDDMWADGVVIDTKEFIKGE